MDGVPNPLLLALTIGVIALLPFIAVMVSAFIKISVVLFILRNALGVQQVPPSMVLNGLALILTAYVMMPVGQGVVNALDVPGVDLNALNDPLTRDALRASVEPVRDFLLAHADAGEREFFARSAERLWPPGYAADVDDSHLLVLVPAFTISELTAAFKIGVLLYLPFVVIDLIVSNVLLAMGMMMVSPVTIALPFKLLLFVLVDGWTRLIHALVLSYQL